MANVTYDRGYMINLYKQTTQENCAGTSIAIRVRRSPEQLVSEGVNIAWPSFGEIATKYGYINEPVESSSLTVVFNALKEGYPVLAEIGIEAKAHWVVITKYYGSDTSYSADNFTCADPATGTLVTLSKATRWTKIYRTRVFK